MKLLALLLVLAQQDLPFDAARLPLAWEVTSDQEVPASARDGVARNLGVDLSGLRQVKIDAGGLKFQLNLIQCPDEETAKQLEAKLDEFKQDTLFVHRQGALVIEQYGGGRLLATKLRDLFGWEQNPTVRWSVSMRVAPLERHVPMGFQPLFDALRAHDAEPGEGPASQIHMRRRGFEFGETVLVRTAEAPWGKPAWSFRPAKLDAERAGDQTRFRFEGLDRVEDVPVLSVEAEIPVRAYAPRPSAAPDREFLTARTPFWPVDDDKIQELVGALFLSQPDAPELLRVEQLLALMNGNVAYGGNVMGSRYGVDQVLAQGFGHCWDKSDVFITLCRAADIPARQVAGWVVGMGGHVWAEVWLEGEGWLEVDATCTWLGTSEFHVPFFLSEDGRPPFVYWQIPELQAR